jgi:hypothetical protein
MDNTTRKDKKVCIPSIVAALVIYGGIFATFVGCMS